MKITKPVQFIKQHCGCLLAIFHNHMKYIKRKIHVKKAGNQYQVADDISISDLTFMSVQLIKIAQRSAMEHAHANYFSSDIGSASACLKHMDHLSCT